MPPTSGAIPFAPDESDDGMTSAEADEVASGVDPDDIGLDEDARPEDAEKEQS